MRDNSNHDYAGVGRARRGEGKRFSEMADRRRKRGPDIPNKIRSDQAG